ncbi:MAG: ASCH domain-containing protein [Clostridia bacterium]|nr:ASCH domain-containing protein [Clostridia bacterium]
MKVLTIKQPWATLIMSGLKRFEFRSWKTNYRGELLIHAGKSIDKEAMKRLAIYLPENLPIGKIIGKVSMVDCILLDKNLKEELLKENPDIYKNSQIGEFAWQVENIEAFDYPIEINGKLGLWNYTVN